MNYKILCLCRKYNNNFNNNNNIIMVYLVKLMCYLLSTVLQDGLEKNFNSVKVLVVDCPDLTKEPFFLSAPGKGKVTACLFLLN